MLLRDTSAEQSENCLLQNKPFAVLLQSRKSHQRKILDGFKKGKYSCFQLAYRLERVV
jgi:hypothetical protein